MEYAWNAIVLVVIEANQMRTILQHPSNRTKQVHCTKYVHLCFPTGADLLQAASAWAEIVAKNRAQSTVS
jgi:hypothetical protein